MSYISWAESPEPSYSAPFVNRLDEESFSAELSAKGRGAEGDHQLSLVEYLGVAERCLPSSMESVIRSMLIFGSFARGERQGGSSDIDVLVVVQDGVALDTDFYLRAGQPLKELNNLTGGGTDYALVTGDDVYKVLSVDFILRIAMEGVVLFGEDVRQEFEQYLENVPQNQYEKALVKRAMFNRHFFRRRMLSGMSDAFDDIESSGQFMNETAKDVMYVGAAYLRITESRSHLPWDSLVVDFVSVANQPEDSNTLQRAYDIRRGRAPEPDGTSFRTLEEMNHFVEKYTALMISKFMERYPYEPLELMAF